MYAPARVCHGAAPPVTMTVTMTTPTRSTASQAAHAGRRHPLGGGLGVLIGAVWRWSPVWIPLLLLWHFAALGLRPALQERHRLEALAPAVEDGHWDSREAFEVLDAEARAWVDPVYRERRRRAGLLAALGH